MKETLSSQHPPRPQSLWSRSVSIKSMAAAVVVLVASSDSAAPAGEPISVKRLPVVKVKRLPRVSDPVPSVAHPSSPRVASATLAQASTAPEPTTEAPEPTTTESPAAASDAAVDQPVVSTTVSHRSHASQRQSMKRSWLRSSTSNASFDRAGKLIDRARQELQAGAWVSAEESTWQALRVAAQGIDQQWIEQNGQLDGELTALEKLEIARTAIVEARDFGGLFGPVDAKAIGRMTRSHQTDLLKHRDHNRLTSNDASECYLDHARVHLADLASASETVAGALDLLASTTLRRNEESHLPSETALCLRRAAIQGQPQQFELAAKLGNQLADLGLLEEAQWALGHSLGIEYRAHTAQRLASVLRQRGDSDQADRVMAELASYRRYASNQTPSNVKATRITRLSPTQFAAISAPVQSNAGPSVDIAGDRDLPTTSRQQPSNRRVPIQLAGARLGADEQQSTSSGSADPQQNKGGALHTMKRWFDSLRTNSQ